MRAFARSMRASVKENDLVTPGRRCMRHCLRLSLAARRERRRHAGNTNPSTPKREHTPSSARCDAPRCRRFGRWSCRREPLPARMRGRLAPRVSTPPTDRPRAVLVRPSDARPHARPRARPRARSPRQVPPPDRRDRRWRKRVGILPGGFRRTGACPITAELASVHVRAAVGRRPVLHDMSHPVGRVGWAMPDDEPAIGAGTRPAKA